MNRISSLFNFVGNIVKHAITGIQVSNTIISPVLSEGNDNTIAINGDNGIEVVADAETRLITIKNTDDVDANLAVLDKITDNYPTQNGMKGSPAIWTVETASCKYMAFAVNSTSKTLYVYGSNNPSNLRYIGRVHLT